MYVGLNPIPFHTQKGFRQFEKKRNPAQLFGSSSLSTSLKLLLLLQVARASRRAPKECARILNGSLAVWSESDCVKKEIVLIFVYSKEDSFSLIAQGNVETKRVCVIEMAPLSLVGGLCFHDS